MGWGQKKKAQIELNFKFEWGYKCDKSIFVIIN